MSTKVTLLYGIPSRDGPQNDYHLYYDYDDSRLHLEVNGKEVPLPPKLAEELHEIIEVYEECVSLIGRLFAHAKKRGNVRSWQSFIDRLGETAFGSSPVKDE